MLFVRRGCAKFRKRLVLATNGRLSVEGGGTIGFSGFLSAWLLKNGCLWLIICVATLMCSFCFLFCLVFEVSADFLQLLSRFVVGKCQKCAFHSGWIFSRMSLILSSVLVVCGAAGGWCCDVTSYVTDTPPLWFEVHQGSLGMHQKTLHQDWWFSYFGPSLKVSSWNLFKPENSFVLKPT